MAVGVKETTSRRNILAEELLNLDTGEWGAKEITHHCKGVRCCRNGLPEIREKLWCAVLVTLSEHEPT